MVTQQFWDLLEAGRSPRVVSVSSEYGSVSENAGDFPYYYAASKAALNMLTRGLAIDLKDQGVTLISLAPGWTRTALGGDGGHWSVEESVTRQREVLSKIGPAQSGQFIDLTGKTVAW